jgi:hypothetical protein
MTEIADKRPIAEDRLSLRDFCELERISVSSYFRMKRAGYGPEETFLPGTSIMFITAEARRAWRIKIQKWSTSKEAKTEAARRSELAKAAGKRAAESPLHVSKRGAKARS